MTYLLTFLEGITAFISPCVLPMLPVYVTYFAAGERSGRTALVNALGFLLGLTAVFVSLGAFAGTLGTLLTGYGRQVEIVGGLLVILFGLHYTGLLQIPALMKNRGASLPGDRLNSLSFPWAVLFGVIFAVSWTPCVGPFLGAALTQAAAAGGTLRGVMMLLLFSLGLGLPFVLSALLLDQLKAAFAAIRRHYTAINRVCGVLLMAIGLSMVLGLFGRLLRLFV